MAEEMKEECCSGMDFRKMGHPMMGFHKMGFKKYGHGLATMSVEDEIKMLEKVKKHLEIKLSNVNERLEINSNVERVASTRESFEIIKNNLWLGVGMGNYISELKNLNPDLEDWNYQPVHNIYLLVVSEIGIIGILLICLALVLLVKKFIKLKVKSLEIVFLFFCFFVFMFLWDHFWWTQASGILIIFLILGFFVNKKSPQTNI